MLKSKLTVYPAEQCSEFNFRKDKKAKCFEHTVRRIAGRQLNFKYSTCRELYQRAVCS